MLAKLPTEKPVNEAVSAWIVAVQTNQFCVMLVQKLKETIPKEGVEFATDASDRK